MVLGLISTKTDSLEAQADLIARIDEAARFVPRDRMALSTQCGFASVAAGNPIRPETQPAKLKLVADTAHRAWPYRKGAHGFKRVRSLKSEAQG